MAAKYLENYSCISSYENGVSLEITIQSLTERLKYET